jgi:8-amino-7-oxononanoate synthase
LSLAQIRDDRVIVASSLAKAFGAPLAMIAGSAARLAEFERRSSTRVHCSPPSAAAIAAATHALAINRRMGDALRARLAERVARLRSGLGSLAASPGSFPVQHVRLPEGIDPVALHAQLRRRGIQTVLSRGSHGSPPRIVFVLTARHEPREIDQASTSLAELTARAPRKDSGGGSGHGKWTDELWTVRRGTHASG